MNLAPKLFAPTVFVVFSVSQAFAQASLNDVSFDKLDRLIEQITEVVEAGEDFALLTDESEDDENLPTSAQICFFADDLQFANSSEAEAFVDESTSISGGVDNLFRTVDDLLRNEIQSVRQTGCDLLSKSIEPEMKKFASKDPLYKVLVHLDDCTPDPNAAESFEPAALAERLKGALKRIDRAFNRYDTFSAACQ